MSFPEIGSRFGGKDHSTVISAVRKIERLVRRGADRAQRRQHDRDAPPPALSAARRALSCRVVE